MRDATRFARARNALLHIARAALVGLACVGAARAEPERRTALVIGIGAYQNTPALDGPVADARAVAAALAGLGFEVVEGYDLRLDAMRALVGAYAAKLDGARVALLYYAGHGIAVAGENYLLPTDAVLRNEADLSYRAVSLAQVLRPMQRADRTSVVLLDAARENPLAADLVRFGRARPGSVGTGLAEVSVAGAPATLVALAAEPGRTAPAGPPGRPGPFAAALLTQIATPGLPLDAAMERVRAEVARATEGAQRPWIAAALPKGFSLNPAPAPAAAAAPSATPSAQPAAPPPSETRPASVGEAEAKLSHKERVEAQTRLKALGFDPGGATGAFGPGTRRALSDWQGSRGLPRTGLLDAAQRTALWEQSEAAYRKLLAARAAAAKARAAAAARSSGDAPESATQPPRDGAPADDGGLLDSVLKAVRR